MVRWALVFLVGLIGAQSATADEVNPEMCEGILARDAEVDRTISIALAKIEELEREIAEQDGSASGAQYVGLLVAQFELSKANEEMANLPPRSVIDDCRETVFPAGPSGD